MKIAFVSDLSDPGASTLVQGIYTDEDFGAAVRALAAENAHKVLEDCAFSTKAGQHIDLPGAGAFARVTLAGVGAQAKADDLAYEAFGGRLTSHLAKLRVRNACVALPAGASPEAIARAALGARSASYRFTKYRTKAKPEDGFSLHSLTFFGDAEAQSRFAEHDRVMGAVFMARDLVNEPPNELYPESFADAAQKLTATGLEVSVFDEKMLAERGFGAIVAVGRGSARPPRLVVLRWQGGDARDAPVAFVGKGVTFDTGGISLKTRPGIGIMKFDMAGAAAVLGLMQVLAERRAKINAVAVLGLAENMPDGEAWRPGDIVRSLSGQTIEVIDTDAEGRMILADALWYAVSEFEPKLIIDVATLTGAVMAALSYQRGGLHANDDALAQALMEAGAAEGEPLWRLPLGEDYDALIESPIADMRNLGMPGWMGGDGAGSTTAAQFLQRFVQGIPWAHLDIPGVAWAHKATATLPEGPTGFGVRLLNRFVLDLEAKTGRQCCMR